MHPTEELIAIINKILSCNIQIDCVVGAGKTSTVLFMAELYPDKKILLLTYNKRLKHETRTRSKATNLEIHSFHSFAVTYINKNCYNDIGLLNSINGLTNGLNSPEYDIIVVDEALDICPLYYQVIQKIISSNKQAKMCIIGDRYQSIYGYNNADARYISLAHKLFKPDEEWVSLRLTNTFRLPQNITKFVNGVSHRGVVSYKQGPSSKVRYLICNQFSNQVYKEVAYYWSKGYKNQDIFIIAPSVKNDKGPVKILANMLTKKGVPIYCPTNDTEAMDDDVVANKIVFCTFHQVKGLERKVSIVFNFDSSYYDYYNKKANKLFISNELYVAITRSLECLTVIHHYKNDYMAFIKTIDIHKIAEVILYHMVNPSDKSEGSNFLISVTDLIRHIPVDVINDINKYINVTEVIKGGTLIKLPSKVKQIYSGLTIYENVSELNGIAIPAKFEEELTGHMTILDSIKKKSYSKSTDEIASLLENANLYSSLKNGLSFKIALIQDYNWLSNDILRTCLDRMNNVLFCYDKSLQPVLTELYFEVPVKKDIPEGILVGYIDCIYKDIIYEFKCVDKLDPIHYILLALYAYLLEGPYKYYLFNILDGSVYEAQFNDCETIVNMLLAHKYRTIKYAVPDDEFIKLNLLGSLIKTVSEVHDVHDVHDIVNFI